MWVRDIVSFGTADRYTRQNRVPSPFYGLHSASKSSSVFSAEKSLSSTPPSSTSSTGRRWGIFSKQGLFILSLYTPTKLFLRKTEAKTPVTVSTSPSKHDSESWGLMRKKSKHNVLKKQHTKSTPSLVLESSALHDSIHDLPPPPSTASSEATLWDNPLLSADSRSLDSPIYFTVDPYWDPSKGDADVYLLPFPQTIEPSVPPRASDTAPRPRARTHACKPPRSLKSVVKTDNETSFLFLK
jgi:hypothetical protein